jgi:hypothetical protein
MLFYDIEAFPHYWCVVVIDDHGIKDTTNVDRHVFEDVESLRNFYKAHYKTHTWVGYNSRQYDAPMLRFIMLGLDPYECSQDLIVLGKKWFEFGYNITQAYKKIPLRNFDCIIKKEGLKKLEGFRGSSIIESQIPWDYPNPFTREQKDETIYYCTHDVLETRKIFYDTYEEYEAHEGLIETFDLDPVSFSKTKAQLSAIILGAVKKPWFDEWEFELVDTLRIEKYTAIVDWYLDKNNHNYDKKTKLKIDVAGVPHVFGWGGIHGARHRYGRKGIFINMDVDSFYPAIMIEYGFLSRNVLNPEKFKEIRDYRLVLKKNKDPRQLPYKIVLNGTFGASKDKYNNLYDPKQANNICVNGQLLLVDLIERVEDHCELVQSNTDGILVRVDTEEQVEIIKAISQEWSERTRMGLSYDFVETVVQKDVNNYLTIETDGKTKAKGAWAKDWRREEKVNGEKAWVDNLVDFDLVILREALWNYAQYNTPIAETINNCKDLRKFQKIIMISSKYKHACHGFYDKKQKKFTQEPVIVKEKYLRVFATTDETKGGIYKIHALKLSVNQVADTPGNSIIINDDITQMTTDDLPELDKEYYIKMAKDRVNKFFTQTA